MADGPVTRDATNTEPPRAPAEAICAVTMDAALAPAEAGATTAVEARLLKRPRGAGMVPRGRAVTIVVGGAADPAPVVPVGTGIKGAVMFNSSAGGNVPGGRLGVAVMACARYVE